MSGRKHINALERFPRVDVDWDILFPPLALLNPYTTILGVGLSLLTHAIEFPPYYGSKPSSAPSVSKPDWTIRLYFRK
jgi:hypothetical protein